MSSDDGPSTHIATADATDVTVRGRSLTRDLIGELGFTEMLFLHIVGREPTPAQAAVVDACLVALMEHGLTPSAITARMTWSSAPEALQGAVAAGLLGVGGVFAGSMEGCGRLLQRLVAAGDLERAAARIAQEHHGAGTRIPGFGHPLHEPDDPRAACLLEVAEEQGVAGGHVGALHALSAAVDATWGRHLTINATGAIAACLADCGVPIDILRGFALISRCAGLVGHIREEQTDPATRTLWRAAERAVPYRAPPDPDDD